MAYLTDYRLFQAFPDIISTDKTIEEISLDHGFPNSKSFIYQFKQRYNMTPNALEKIVKLETILRLDKVFESNYK